MKVLNSTGFFFLFLLLIFQVSVFALLSKGKGFIGLFDTVHTQGFVSLKLNSISKQKQSLALQSKGYYEEDHILTQKANKISADRSGGIEIFKYISSITGIVTVTDHGKGWRVLRFNGNPQSVNRLDLEQLKNENDFCYMEPLKVMLSAALVCDDIFRLDAAKILVVGLGGGILPSQLDHLMGKSIQCIDVIDIEDATEKACKDHLGIDTQRWNIHIADAVTMIKNNDPRLDKEYHFIFLDAFDGTHEQPSGMLDTQFMSALKGLLAEQGVLITNFRKPGPPLEEMLDMISLSWKRGLDLVKVSQQLGSSEKEAAQAVASFQRKLDAQRSVGFEALYILPVENHGLAITVAINSLKDCSGLEETFLNSSQQLSASPKLTFDIVSRISRIKPIQTTLSFPFR